MVCIDEDLPPQPRPLFQIVAVYVLNVSITDLSTATLAAPYLWSRAFRIDPLTGVITTFGKLDLLVFQGVILTIAAVDDKWYPPQLDLFNLTVLLAFTYVV